MKKTKLIKLLKKNFTQVLLGIIAILLLANLVTKQNLLAGLTLFNPPPTPAPTLLPIAPSPTSTPTVTQTPTPVYIYIQPTTTPTPTGPSKKEQLDGCLKKADAAYFQNWAKTCKNNAETGYNNCVKGFTSQGVIDQCREEWNDSGPNCSLPTSQADYLENVKANSKDNCYSQFTVSN